MLLMMALVLSWPIGTAAQPAEQQSLQVEGLAITPFIIEIDAEPGQTINRKISLTNTTQDRLPFVASIHDFVPNGTSGQPLFLPVNQDADPTYSLSRWVRITQQPDFVIPPRGQTEIGFTIEIPSEVEPGTHYGGILFGREASYLNELGSAVQHKAGTIILVKIGKSQEQLELTGFTTDNKLYRSGPVGFKTVLRNNGNVHSKPKGEITIKNLFGGQITQIPINRDANIVLPQATREFTSQWIPKWNIGRYTAEAVLYYGNPKLELRTTEVFWVIPVTELVFSILFLLILGIILYIGIRKYNRYIINRSHEKN